MSSWQLIFSQSKVNSSFYDGDRLVAQNWDWPKETWFQTRVRDLRERSSKNSEQRRSWARVHVDSACRIIDPAAEESTFDPLEAALNF